MSPIAVAIRKARFRLRLNRFITALVQGLTALFVVLILPAAAIKLFDLDWNPFHLLWIVSLALPWAIYSLWRAKITDSVASLEVDDRFRLRERISSAWYLRERHEPMVDMLQTDAERHAEGLELDSRFPIELPKRTPIAAAPLAIFAAVCLWLPALPEDVEEVAQAKTAEETLDKEKAEAIAKLLKPKQQDPKRIDTPKAATGEADFEQALSDLGKRLKDEKLTRKEALAALSNQQKDLQDKKNRLAKLDQARSQLDKPRGEEKFTKKVRENLSAGDYSKAAEAMGALSNQLTNGDLSAADIEQLSKELDSLSRALEGNTELQASLKKALDSLKGSKTGNDGKSGLSPAELAKLQKALAKLSGNLGDLQRLKDRQNELESVLSQIDLAKLMMCDGLSQCKACGGICNASGTCGKCGMGGAGAFGKGIGIGQGAGMGGPGRGRGNMANRYQEPEVQMQDENIRTRWQPGTPLGTVEVDAEHSPAYSALGDSPAFVEAGDQEQSVVQEEVPPGYEEIVQGYFDRGQ